MGRSSGLPFYLGKNLALSLAWIEKYFVASKGRKKDTENYFDSGIVYVDCS